VDERSYGLIVEGVYDEGVYPDPLIRVLQCGGVSKLMNKLPGYLKSLEYVWNGGPVSKAIVIRDWREADLAKAEQLMAQRVEGRAFSFPHGIQFCAVRQELEAWLLADADAISTVAEQRGGRAVWQLQGQLEEIPDPKEKLTELLSRARLPYDPTVCAEIARISRLERLRNRCAAFRLFEQKVIDC
jgi:hypothetical protein